MAKLILPTTAFSWKGKRINNHGRLVSNKNFGKFHLARIDHSKYLWAACGKFVGKDEPTLAITRISELKAEDLCEACLGAIKAVDD